MRVRNTEAPISVPVGAATLGRIFDVLGDPVDDGGAVRNVRADDDRVRPR